MLFDLNEKKEERNQKVLAYIKSKDIKSLGIEELSEVMGRSHCLTSVDGEKKYLKEIMPLFYENDDALVAMSYGAPELYSKFFDLDTISRRVANISFGGVYFAEKEASFGGYDGLRTKNIEKWLKDFDLSTMVNKKNFMECSAGDKEALSQGEPFLWERLLALTIDKYVGPIVVGQIDSLIRSPLGQKVEEFFEKGEEYFFKKYSEKECFYAKREEIRNSFEAIGLVFFLALIRKSSKKQGNSFIVDKKEKEQATEEEKSWQWCEKVYKKIREKIYKTKDTSYVYAKNKAIGVGGLKEVLLLDEMMAKVCVLNDSARGLWLVLKINGSSTLSAEGLSYGEQAGAVKGDERFEFPGLLKRFQESQKEVRKIKSEEVNGSLKSIGNLKKDLNNKKFGLGGQKNFIWQEGTAMSLSLAAGGVRGEGRGKINEHLRGAQLSELPVMQPEYYFGEQDRQIANFFYDNSLGKGRRFLSLERVQKAKEKLNRLKVALYETSNLMMNLQGQIDLKAQSYGSWLTTDLMVILGSVECLSEVLKSVKGEYNDLPGKERSKAFPGLDGSNKEEIIKDYLKQKVVLKMVNAVPIECWLDAEVLRVFVRQKKGKASVFKCLEEAFGESDGSYGSAKIVGGCGKLSGEGGIKVVMEEVSEGQGVDVKSRENNVESLGVKEFGIFKAKDEISSKRLLDGEFVVVSEKAWNYINKIKKIKECEASKRRDLWQELFGGKVGVRVNVGQHYKQRMSVGGVNIKSQSLYFMQRKVPVKSVACLIELGAMPLGSTLRYLKVADEGAYNFYSKTERLAKLEEAQLNYEIKNKKPQQEGELKDDGVRWGELREGVEVESSALSVGVGIEVEADFEIKKAETYRKKRGFL